MNSNFLHLLIMIVSIAGLAWSADVFVVGASRMGIILRLPKMFVGILLVGFATTAPELAVSVQSAYLGHTEIALGNALGSVMADDGLAIALAAMFAATAIPVEARILRSAGLFLVAIDILAYGLAWNGSIERVEGALLLVLLVGYYFWVIRTERRRRTEESLTLLAGAEQETCPYRWGPCLARFFLGLAGVIVASHFVITSAVALAETLGVSQAVVGLTMVAFGTSLPEIATCIAAARRGEGQIAVGNIIGADILNVLWIVGMSAAVRPIRVPLRIINFAFPWMLAIVITMLVSMRIGHSLTRTKGLILFLLYVAYIASAVKWFY